MRDGLDTGHAPLADGGALAYAIHGRAHAGPPVLLVRPLGGSMDLWGRFRARLADDFCVVSYDLRGTGGSRSAWAWSTTRGLARDAIFLLDHLEIARAHVFGLSLGSMIATWLAVDAPARVARLCLASTCARGIEVTRTGVRRELALASCFLHRGPEVEPRLVDRLLSSRFRAAQPVEVARIEAALRAAPVARAALLTHALAGVLHDARGALSTIGAPTLVLAGADDTLLGTAPSHAVSVAIPRAVFAIVAESGHDLTLEQPIATAARVIAHFRDR
ncbi:MAG: alpha/beta hydrolase [Proteobacteria bacterium]|nr:alpha/beta hydrolase [Pseudomonadota bacterium]